MLSGVYPSSSITADCVSESFEQFKAEFSETYKDLHKAVYRPVSFIDTDAFVDKQDLLMFIIDASV